MGNKTGIEWTGSTWTPIRARLKANALEIASARKWLDIVEILQRIAAKGRQFVDVVGPHCEMITTGCAHCYSGSNNARLLPANGTGLPFDQRARELVDIFIDEKILAQPRKWRAPRSDHGPESIWNSEEAANTRVVQLGKHEDTRHMDVCVLRCDVGAAYWNSTEPDPKPDFTNIRTELEELQRLLNTPEIEDFLKGVQVEAAHQRKRWGDAHDEMKRPGDWAMLFSAVLGKLARAVWNNERSKYLHHLITLSAIAFNCHRIAAKEWKTLSSHLRENE